MNPHPASLAVDLFALVASFGAGLLVCWLVIGVWHVVALRREYRSQRDASNRVMARARGLMCAPDSRKMEER